ncbi:phage minor structural protein, N-terminal region [Peptoniphilus asaccharolyticus DSM 20463]|uniref:Phage minor structural protein, N-terminal region n=1 Tax=Peptoniphilus asaccharolyticus DSM 20463 TaxID=573058 RepID=A0A1W1UYV7_PEPAS|nr:phage tail spike protein [Peptoniphilus asaccharolyticus]MBL7575361.1 phage tail protein [Peptoniphilus asaccharolyticus]SMB86246.1 phage minor structural protein, N-terminal region [Peptoniphilus asaccharolyticus DSM 20463]
MMLEVFDKNLKRVAYLENAFGIIEDLKINSINYLNFKIPNNDPKVTYLKPFYYVKCNENLYRILPKVIETEEVEVLSVECEHVLATLLNDVIFGNVIIGNLGTYTREVLEFVLSKQKIKNWKLGRCDFSRQFEYCWENENLASALFSVPKPLAEDYMWTFETENYPWTINLIKLNKDSKPDAYIQKKKNQLRLVRTSDPKQLFTRIYPLGYGEGINQLTIKDVNNGIPYLQSPQNIIDKYGIIETTWIDRRYENAQSLKDSAQVMLNEFQEPLMEYEVDYQAIDVREKLGLGSKIRIIDEDDSFDDFVVGIRYEYDDIKKTTITIANKSRTVATSIADLADRQRIEMTYSQGATQLYAQSLQVNADSKHGAEINFFIPNEMRVINKVVAKVKLESFRAYSKATEGGGGYVDSTSAGGGDYGSTSAGGGDYGSTSSGGGEYGTTHGIEDVQAGDYRYNVIGGTGYVEIYKVTHHEHKLSISDHSHSFSISDHSHSFRIDDHSHTIRIPDHEHRIVPGIYTFGDPKRFEIKVNGKSRGYVSSTNWEYDVTKYLLDNKKRISRGSWQSIEIIPNDLAYISIDLMLQGFVQSRGDYTV